MGRPKKFLNERAESLRLESLTRLDSLAAIQHMQPTQLLALQAQFGFGSVWGLIVIPEEFMPPGRHRGTSRRVIDFRAIANGSDAAIAAVTKLMCLRWLAPAGASTEPISTATLSGMLRDLKRLLELALSKPSSDPNKIWSRLSKDDLYSLLPVTANGTDSGMMFRSFKEQGLLDDVIDVAIDRTARRLEKSRRGKGIPKATNPKVAPYVHLPDEFVAECGWRCIWLVKTLGPTLIDLLESIFRSEVLRADVSTHEARTQFRRAAARRICDWKWLAQDRTQIDFLPFSMSVNSRAGLKSTEKSKPMAWPPRSLPDLWSLLALIQGAHALIVGISGGPRHSEILGQTQQTLVETNSGHKLEGKTYKLVFKDEGEDRDWPAPELAIFAVMQQVRIAQTMNLVASVLRVPKEGDHLWVRLPTHTFEAAGAPLLSLDVILRNLVGALGLSELLAGPSVRDKNLHPHRLRKTTARIVGLALTNSIQVLMDLFGHEDPEMTMRYLLSNRDIAEEAKAVAEAQTIMFAVAAIEDEGQGGGAAAATVRNRTNEFAKLRGVDKLDAKDIDELARDLTENGQYWELVRPGVICTKLPGQIGACNGKMGAADSSRCKSTCQNRYEMASNVGVVDSTIARIVEHLQKAIDDDEPMAAEQWRGQLLQNIHRFDSLREKWSQHPIVSAELEEQMTPEL